MNRRPVPRHHVLNDLVPKASERRSKLLVGAFALALVLAGVTAQALPVEKSFPLPLRVESSTERSSIYLTLDAESPLQTVSQLASSAGQGSAEAFLQQVVATLTPGNLAAFTALADPSGDAELPQFFSRYQSAFATTPDPMVRDVFYLGKLTYFVLDVDYPEVPIAPVPVLETASGFVHSFSLLLDPIVQNVSGLARNRKLSPSTYGAVTSVPYNTEIALPPLYGSTGAHPVSLRFTGVAVPQAAGTQDKSAALPAGVQEALDFYRGYHQALARRDSEALRTLYGPRSRQKFEQFLALAANPEPRGEVARKWLKSGVPQGSAEKAVPDLEPIYVIVAGSLYLFFHEASVEDLSFEYVRSGPSGLEVVNFAHHNTLDTLLLWPPVAEDLQGEMTP